MRVEAVAERRECLGDATGGRGGEGAGFVVVAAPLAGEGLEAGERKGDGALEGSLAAAERVEPAGGAELDEAAAGRSVTLRLADDVDLSRGDTLVAADDVPTLTQDLTGVLCWLGDTELRPGARVLVKHRSRTVPAIVRSIEGRLDLDTLATEPSDRLSLNDIGQVTLRTASPLPIEDYSRSRSGGAFLVIDPTDGNTVAAGMAGTP